MPSRVVTFVFFLMVPCCLLAQSIPSDSSALVKSEGAGMARYAEANGYPGPKHVLELQEELMLNEDQAKQVEAIFDEMAEKARDMGEEIISAEVRLNALFAAKTAAESSVETLSAEIGRMRGELRAIHLSAHLQTSAILSVEQREQYSKLRHGAGQHKH